MTGQGTHLSFRCSECMHPITIHGTLVKPCANCLEQERARSDNHHMAMRPQMFGFPPPPNEMRTVSCVGIWG